MNLTPTYSSFDLRALWSHPNTPLQFHLWETAIHSRSLVSRFNISSVIPLIISKQDTREVSYNTINLDGDFIAEMAILIGLSHDLGKATKFFQGHVRGEKIRPRTLSEHSLLSSFFGFYLALNYFSEKPTSESVPSKLKTIFSEAISTIVYLVIRRHHSNLQPAADDILDLSSLSKKRKDNIMQQLANIDTQLLEKLVNQNFHRAHSSNLLKTKLVFTWIEFQSWITSLFQGKQFSSRKWFRILRRHFRQQQQLTANLGKEILAKSHDFSTLSSILLTILLYSALQQADKSSAMNISLKPRRTDFSLSKAVNNFQLGLKSTKSPLNKYRNEIFNLCHQKALSIDLDNDRLLSLNVPTGFGKTLSGLNFAATLRERIIHEGGGTPRIIYAMPFLSIIEQNHAICELIFRSIFTQKEYKNIPTDILLKHHHLSEVTYETDGNKGDFTPNEALFMIEGWQSEVIITTFYQFLYCFLTRSKNSLRKFQSIGGAIVILDEVQNVDGHYWEIIRHYLKALAYMYNIYFVLVTATLPLIFRQEEILSILPAKNVQTYYQSIDRVILDVDLNLMAWEKFLQWIYQLICENPTKNIMFVMNTIKSSKKLCSDLKDLFRQSKFKQTPNFFYLSTYITPKERLERIEKVTAIVNDVARKKPLILITTQLVEAGVDLDFDIIVRDFGPLDSLFQVAGRCNRHSRSKKPGLVYVRKLLDPLTEKERILSNYIYDSILQGATEQVLQNFINKKPDKRIPESEFFTLAQEYYKELRNRLSQDTSLKLLEAAATLEFDKFDEFKLIKDDYSREPIFIEIDRNAHDIWKKYEKITSFDNPFERKHHFISIRKQFYEHVISVRADLAKNLPLSSGFRLLTLESLVHFYDNTEDEGTGFLDQDLSSESRSLIF